MNVSDGAATLNFDGSGATTLTTVAYDHNATGAITIDASGTNAISIGADTNTGNINIGSGASARTIQVGNAASTAVNVDALAIDLTSVNAMNVSDGAATLNFNGSGATTLTTVAYDHNASGNITIDSSAGSISIGNDDIDQTINLATGGTRTLNIGINDGTDVTTLAVKGNSTHTGTVTVGTPGTGHNVQFYGDSNDKYMLWDQAADTLKVEGTVQATNVIAVSDGTLKTNISPLNDPLATINKLHGVQYDWKDPNNNDHEIGLIAQDVETVVPEVVRTLAGTNLKGVEYQKLTAILIEAVKELSNQVNELKKN